MPALIVEAGAHRFALPQHSVIEVVGINDEDDRHEIENVCGSLVLRLRGEVLPLIDLKTMLDIAPNEQVSMESRAVVMGIGTHSFAVLVDSVADVKEVVVKPLGASLSHLNTFSGQTILGDGSVVLILDPTGLAAGLGLSQVNEYKIIATTDQPDLTTNTRLVLFRAGSGAVKAIPLSLITRIEIVASSMLERCDNAYVMRHNGNLMLLLPIAEVTPAQEHPVLVMGVGGEHMGLLVDEILDIVEEPLNVEIASTTPGIIGSAPIRDMTVELIDITHFMRLGRPDAFARRFTRRFHILLVDDKQFFRDMLSPVLKAAGYDVTTAESGEEALKFFAKGRLFDAVVTDTEMPHMSGYALARSLTSEERFSNLPVLALAAHASSAVEHAAAASGMRGVIGKFDRNALLRALHDCLDISSLGGQELEASIIGGLAA
jgi:two-component system chemotaxis sensor kinase CheA